MRVSENQVPKVNLPEYNFNKDILCFLQNDTNKRNPILKK